MIAAHPINAFISVGVSLSIQDNQSLAVRIRRGLHLRQVRLSGTFGIQENTNSRSSGKQLMQELYAFGVEFVAKQTDACDIAARPVERCDEPSLHRIGPGREYYGNL